jgi:hypothetical protein
VREQDQRHSSACPVRTSNFASSSTKLTPHLSLRAGLQRALKLRPASGAPCCAPRHTSAHTKPAKRPGNV